MNRRLPGLVLVLALVLLASPALADEDSHELSALLLAGVEAPPQPYWDEREQAWRDPQSLKVWWLPSPGWVASDGLGHYWFDSGWRYRDGSLYVVPPPPAPVYSADAGVEQWRWLVAAYFPAYAVDSALWIMQCESNGRPWVTSSAGAIGLLQLMPFHAWRAGYGDLYDPETNIRAAAHLYLEQGWGPWIACL